MSAELYLLGTGASISDPHRTTTMLAFAASDSIVLVDCGGDAFQRLLVCGLDPGKITALIVTHEHPDHVSGFPLLVEKLWLGGRRKPLPVCGIPPAVRQARRAFESFDTSGWPDLTPLNWREAPEREGALVWEDEVWHIVGAPGVHAVPCIGLKVTDKATGRTVAYSGDTEPSQAICRLARHVDVLVHEATGTAPGHSSGEDAANIANEAKARRLLLVHLPPFAQLDDGRLAKIKRLFSNVERGKEGGRYPFGDN